MVDSGARHLRYDIILKDEVHLLQWNMRKINEEWHKTVKNNDMPQD